MTNNPLKKVDGVLLPVPTTYQYSINDLSKSTAGRTQDMTMHKEKIGSCVKINLSWEWISVSEAMAVFKAFEKEYITVEYLDGRTGNYQQSEFYAGAERSAGKYNATIGKWESITVNLIERKGKKYV